MPKQSHEIAQESRDNEAEILGGRSRRAVINGREYTFLQPSRRDNRIMFAEVVKIQQIAQRPENRVRALMEMFQFLIDWHPMIAAVVRLKTRCARNCPRARPKPVPKSCRHTRRSRCLSAPLSDQRRPPKKPRRTPRVRLLRPAYAGVRRVVSRN